MKNATKVLALGFIVGYSSMASAGLIFDIVAKENSMVLGHIEFSSSGILEDASDVVDFDYTQRFDGINFVESDITQLRVLVDTLNGTLCWGDWTVAETTVPNQPDGCGTAPPSDVPRGLTAVNASFMAFDNFGFESGTPNQSVDAGDDDEDLIFVMRMVEVPEPGTLGLLGAGLLGLGFARRKKA